MTELIAQLTELGLTRNAALAWLTLLREAGQEGLTGYEVAANENLLLVTARLAKQPLRSTRSSTRKARELNASMWRLGRKPLPLRSW